MVFGYKAPITRVGRVVSIVAHHKVVIHLERIFVRQAAVYEYFTFFYLESIAFVISDNLLINRQIVER